MKLAIVVGHNERSQGAVRVIDNESEWIWNTALASRIKSYSPKTVEIFFRVRNSRGYRAEIGEVYAKVDEWGADVSCELHFNSSSLAMANGTETWYVSKNGEAYAKQVQKAMLEALGLKDRGIKKAGSSDRGYSSLVTGRCPAVLIEPYFGSNSFDCELASLRMENLAKGIFTSLGGIPHSGEDSLPPELRLWLDQMPKEYKEYIKNGV